MTQEPWQLLRIGSEGFEFAATGLPTFPARRQNLIALAATIGSRVDAARCGPGLQWIGTDSAPREHRLPNQSVYQGYLRWQLTRMQLP